MEKNTAKFYYDYMIAQLKSKNITRKQSAIYKQAIKNLAWYYGF